MLPVTWIQYCTQLEEPEPPEAEPPKDVVSLGVTAWVLATPLLCSVLAFFTMSNGDSLLFPEGGW